MILRALSKKSPLGTIAIMYCLIVLVFNAQHLRRPRAQRAQDRPHGALDDGDLSERHARRDERDDFPLAQVRRLVHDRQRIGAQRHGGVGAHDEIVEYWTEPSARPRPAGMNHAPTLPHPREPSNLVPVPRTKESPAAKCLARAR